MGSSSKLLSWQIPGGMAVTVVLPQPERSEDTLAELFASWPTVS